jgi:hypothetical protein
MREPIAIVEKDLAAKTIEPLVTRIFDQLVEDVGLDEVQSMLPIDVSVTFTLRSGDRTIVSATMGSRVESLNAVS